MQCSICWDKKCYLRRLKCGCCDNCIICKECFELLLENKSIINCPLCNKKINILLTKQLHLNNICLLILYASIIITIMLYMIYNYIRVNNIYFNMLFVLTMISLLTKIFIFDKLYESTFMIYIDSSNITSEIITLFIKWFYIYNYIQVINSMIPRYYVLNPYLIILYACMICNMMRLYVIFFINSKLSEKIFGFFTLYIPYYQQCGTYYKGIMSFAPNST